MIEQLKEKKRQLESRLLKIKRSIKEVDDSIKKELQKLPFIEGLAEYIKYQEYPTSLFNNFGIDPGEHDSFGKARIKIVYNYGYTDVVGLTEEEFEELTNLL